MLCSLSQWKEFQSSDIYKDIIDELDERDMVVMNSLRAGNDKDWSDDNMRGRLSELDYIRTLIPAIIVDLEIAELASKKEKGFIDKIKDKFKREE